MVESESFYDVDLMDLEIRKKEALESQNALNYYLTCDAIGLDETSVEDRELYGIGKMNYQEQLKDSKRREIMMDVEVVRADPDIRLSHLESLAHRIKEKMDTLDEVQGQVSFTEGVYQEGMGVPVTRHYNFLGGHVKENATYDDSREAMTQALQDCIDTIQLNVEPLEVIIEKKNSDKAHLSIRFETN